MSSHIAKLTPKNSYNVAVLLIMAWNKNGENVYQSVIYIYFLYKTGCKIFVAFPQPTMRYKPTNTTTRRKSSKALISGMYMYMFVLVRLQPMGELKP